MTEAELYTYNARSLKLKLPGYTSINTISLKRLYETKARRRRNWICREVVPKDQYGFFSLFSLELFLTVIYRSGSLVSLLYPIIPYQPAR
jgi:hypothetical protein